MDTLDSHFVAATLELDGQTYRVSKAAGDRLVTRSQPWHAPGDPSTWLCAAVFQKLRTKYKDLPQSARLELGARWLGITATKLHEALTWHEQYVRFREGHGAYRVLDPD